MPQSKSFKSGVAQLMVAVVVTGGMLLLGAVASNASAGRTGQSEVEPCRTTTTSSSIIPQILRGAAQGKPTPDPCEPTTTVIETTTTTAPTTTTTMMETTTMVETTTTMPAATTTTVKPIIKNQVLARTGSNTVPMIVLALGMLVAGGAALMTAARKRTA